MAKVGVICNRSAVETGGLRLAWLIQGFRD